jgi:hypothetical protein
MYGHRWEDYFTKPPCTPSWFSFVEMLKMELPMQQIAENTCIGDLTWASYYAKHPEMLAVLATLPIENVRKGVACNSNIPADVLKQLIADEDITISMIAVQNPRLTYEIATQVVAVEQDPWRKQYLIGRIHRQWENSSD